METNVLEEISFRIPLSPVEVIVWKHANITHSFPTVEKKKSSNNNKKLNFNLKRSGWGHYQGDFR